MTQNDLQSGSNKDKKFTKDMLNVISGANAVTGEGEFEMLRTRLLKHQGSEYRLSCEEQVKCIIEQSTDPDVLGRTYMGWEPFM